MEIKLLYICIICLIYNILICHGYKRVCYYTNWSQYRKGIGKFVPENIDVNLCTHLIYAFAKLDGNQLAPVEWNDDTTPWSKGMYERFNNLKLENPSLRTILAVGGWNFGSKPFSDMASVPASRSEFVNSTMTFLRKRNFDGLDLDWEYPARRGGPPQDKVNLASLVKELRLAFEEESKVSRRPRLLLTMAVPADEEKINDGYDVSIIAKQVDFINLMSYDLHGAWDPTTGHNSPLFARAQEVGYAAQKNVKWAADYWVKLGTPRDKLIIGFPLFGRGFTLMDSAVHEIGSPVAGGSIAGPHTNEIGYISYYEVCKLIADGAHVYRDPEQKVPHFVLADQWIGYDDVESFTEKAIWVKQNKFGGVMLWSLALDDFTGTSCKTGIKFPMAKTLLKILTMQHASQLNTSSTSDILLEPSKATSSTTERNNSIKTTLGLTHFTNEGPTIANTIKLQDELDVAVSNTDNVSHAKETKSKLSINDTSSQSMVSSETIQSDLQKVVNIDETVPKTAMSTDTNSRTLVDTDNRLDATRTKFISEAKSVANDRLDNTQSSANFHITVEDDTGHDNQTRKSDNPQNNLTLVPTESNVNIDLIQNVTKTRQEASLLVEEMHISLKTNDTDITGLVDNANIKLPISHKTIAKTTILIDTHNATLSPDAIAVTTMQEHEVMNNMTALESNSRLKESESTDLSGLTERNNNQSFANVSKVYSVSQELINVSVGIQNQATFTDTSSLHTNLTEPQNNSYRESALVSGREKSVLEAVTIQSVTTTLLNDAVLQRTSSMTRVVINSQDNTNNTSTLVDTTITNDNAMSSNVKASIESSIQDNKSLISTEQSEKMPDNASLVDVIDSVTVSLRTTTDATTTIPQDNITKRKSSFRTKSRKSKSKSNVRGKNQERAKRRSSRTTGDTIDTNIPSPEFEVNRTGNQNRLKRSNHNDYHSQFRKRSLLQVSETSNPESRSHFNSVLGSLLDLVSNFATGNRRNAHRASDSTGTVQEQNRELPSATETPTVIPDAIQRRLIQTLRTRNRQGSTTRQSNTIENANQANIDQRLVSTQLNMRSRNRIINPARDIELTGRSQIARRLNTLPNVNRLVLERLRGTSATNQARLTQTARGSPTNDLSVSQTSLQGPLGTGGHAGSVTDVRSGSRDRNIGSAQNSVQNGQITDQLHDSFVNQVINARENPSLTRLDINRLQASLLQAQSRNENQNTIGTKGTIRRPVTSNVNRNALLSNGFRVENPTLQTLGSTNGMRDHKNALLERLLPQLGVELDVTDLAGTKGPNASLAQSIDHAVTNINRQQMTRQMPERHLGVQPNIAAQRLLQNDMHSVDQNRIIQQQNKILIDNPFDLQTNGLNQLRSSINSGNNGIASNQLQMTMNSINSHDRSDNSLLSTKPHISDDISLFPRINLQLNSLEALPQNLSPGKSLITDLNSFQNSDPTNDLRLDDLKLSSDFTGNNINSILSQIQSFRDQTNFIAHPPNEQSALMVMSEQPILSPVNAIKIDPSTSPTTSKPQNNIASMLKIRFPQLNTDQAIALTQEIQRQVKEVVQIKLAENIKNTSNAILNSSSGGSQQMAKQPSVNKLQINQIPLIDNQPNSGVSTDKDITNTINPDIKQFQVSQETKETNSKSQIKGLQMLSKQADAGLAKNVGNVINLEQLRQELARSGVPANLVIQINPVPVLTQRGTSGFNAQIPTHGILGIEPTAALGSNAQRLSVPEIPVVSRIQSSNKASISRVNNNLRRRLQTLPVSTSPSLPPKMDAIQSPHELIINEKGKAAAELSALPSTPSTSPREQIQPSNRTVILSSQLKPDSSLPKSEVLWKWQLK